jgi:hypothetical protein
MGLLEKIADAESSDWLCKDMTDEEVIKVISEAKEEARKRIKLVDTLDKIRAEIEQIADEEQKHDEKWAIGLRYAVKIIDKYKEESEE